MLVAILAAQTFETGSPKHAVQLASTVLGQKVGPAKFSGTSRGSVSLGQGV